MAGLISVSEPPVNYASQGAIAAKQVLLNPLKNIWLLASSGAPTIGQGNGWAGPGSLALSDSGDTYQQIGTLAATVWTALTKAGGSVIFPSASGLTAHAGGGGTNALQLASGFSRVTTVATNGDSVKLPPAVAGTLVVLSNEGANPTTVYPNGTDQIEDSTSPVTQLAGQDQIYVSETAGKWYSVGGYLVQVAGPLTAHAGGGQGSATLLPSQANLIGTVATPGDSAALPAAVPGSVVTVVNNGANAAQIYGSGTDTINGIAFGTGVSQIPSSTVVYTCIVAGAWTTDGGIGAGYAGQYPTMSYKDGLTAHAGGGKASALALTAIINRVSVAASPADSVLLPAAIAGMSITIINDGVSSIQVFGAGTDTVDSIVTTTGVAMAAAKRATFFCTTTGAWYSLAGAKSS